MPSQANGESRPQERAPDNHRRGEARLREFVFELKLFMYALYVLAVDVIFGFQVIDDGDLEAD